MALYLIDSDILADWLNGIVAARDYLLALEDGGHTLATTAVSIAEVVAGTRPDKRDAVATALGRYLVLELDAIVGRRAGEYRYDFARRGQPLPTTDTLIAAAAFVHGAIIVTRNRRHYPMGDIVLASLS